LVDIFKALSDGTRLRILSMIWNREMCVCEIEKCLGLTQSNASRHLTALKNAGILTSAKHAQWAYYTVNKEFCEKNIELCNYLNIRLKELTTYQADIEQMAKCKTEKLCD